MGRRTPANVAVATLAKAEPTQRTANRLTDRASSVARRSRVPTPSVRGVSHRREPASSVVDAVRVVETALQHGDPLGIVEQCPGLFVLRDVDIDIAVLDDT